MKLFENQMNALKYEKHLIEQEKEDWEAEKARIQQI